MGASAVFTALGFIFSFVAEVRKGGKVVINLKNNVSASATVATVGTACVNVFFTVECNGTITAVTCNYSYFCFINKHFYLPRYLEK
jgi:uncharacterized protein (UPF0333 family)